MKKNIFLLGLSLLLVSCNVNNPTENNSIDPSIENSKEEVSSTEVNPDLSYLSGKLNSSESIHYFGDGSFQTVKTQYYYYETGEVSKVETTHISNTGTSAIICDEYQYEYKDGYLSKKIKSNSKGRF